ncbi:RNAse R [Acetitomaculum ruminis DSM 5522]|uniref:Ribonuclease R n=1 Tax=Acetitomaculum ruminis DSM 5522 TaxID=1120918 RepID=A0A1I0UXP3_9FIRM|nr:ribonuclease R [Acetitomaculum ruminis]SFA68818.1 RNAse R [Acetitomaculum ruminis DSM 5522]
MDKKEYSRRKKIIYSFICDKLYTPMKLKELCIFFGINKDGRDSFKEMLDELCLDGKIELTKRGKYVKAKEKEIIGTYIQNPRGFGFVEFEESEEDIFIPPDEINGAFNKDKVVVKILSSPEGKRVEGSIVRIVERAIIKVVGVFQKSKNFGFVIADNKAFLEDIFIPKEKCNDAKNGDKVLVKLTSYGGNNKKPEGAIIEILGKAGDKGVDVLSILKDYDVPVEFPEKVLNQAGRVSKGLLEEDMYERRDLRDIMMVTIDDITAKDLDDAVSLSFDGKYYELGVHIADVTNYVQENSALDKEALKRGTSIYPVDRVVPMLPPVLSNGICSLNEGEDRLALSCLMKIDTNGSILDSEIVESVINVDRRMTYVSVSQILEGDENEALKYRGFVEMFKQMSELSDILRRKRHDRGAIDFDFAEAKIILDENGKAKDVITYERTKASMIIEDFMLAANETVAETFYWQELPFVYRNHDKPDNEKLNFLASFIGNFGFSMHIGEEVHPKEIQKLMDKIEGCEEEALIKRLTLRSMKQAKYTTSNSNHFGLAAKYYCHFTSPIRRYPDLQIHRIIKECLRGKLNDARKLHYENILDEVAAKSSKAERQAEEIEREAVKMKKAEYMKKHIGEEYEGVISGMNRVGIYVGLENTIEGMIHVNDMIDDYYEFYEDRYEMVGTGGGRCYKLGQKVKIIVSSADTHLRTINFVFAG